MSTPILQVTLGVSDVERSVRFYRDVLGFKFQGFWDSVSRTAAQEWTGPGKPEYGEVRVGDGRIGLRPAGAGPASSGQVEMAIHVDSASQLHRRIKSAGGNPTNLADQPWGSVMFSITDPDGFQWQLIEMKKPC
jgi:catechol 2,3-dioxygenase-like lactoylglutathione lyase family enzyme